ncbi:hypothetical protein [Actinoplanes sp. NPDC023714]|uniref:hypothetical protein n=1 Tax=Actinoplanes sp. NPDC023714 TaxID=3154322 RepID=UPI0033DFE1BD
MGKIAADDLAVALSEVARSLPHETDEQGTARGHDTVLLPDTTVDDRWPAFAGLSVRLGALGRRDEGLAASVEAVGVYRNLARARPDAFLPDLALSLNNLSIRLGELGRRDEGLAAWLTNLEEPG